MVDAGSMKQRTSMIGYTIDLVRLHQLYERNFVALLKLFPECLQDDDLWVVIGASELTSVHFEVKQRSAYTTYLSITVGGGIGAQASHCRRWMSACIMTWIWQKWCFPTTRERRNRCISIPTRRCTNPMKRSQ